MKNLNNDLIPEEDILDKLSQNSWLKQIIKNNNGNEQRTLRFIVKRYNNIKGFKTPVLNNVLNNMGGLFSPRTVFWVLTHPLEWFRNIRDLYQIAKSVASEQNPMITAARLLSNDKIFEILQGEPPEKAVFGKMAYKLYEGIFLNQMASQDRISQEDFAEIADNFYNFAHKYAKKNIDSEKNLLINPIDIFYAFVEEFYTKNPSFGKTSSQIDVMVKILHPVLLSKIKLDILQDQSNISKDDNSVLEKVVKLLYEGERINTSAALSYDNQKILLKEVVELVNIVAVKLVDRRPNANVEISLNDMNKSDLIDILMNDPAVIKKFINLGESLSEDKMQKFLDFVVDKYVITDKGNNPETKQVLAEQKKSLVKFIELMLKSAKIANQEKKENIDQKTELEKQIEGLEAVPMKKILGEMAKINETALRDGYGEDEEDLAESEKIEVGEPKILPFYLRLMFPSNDIDKELFENLRNLVVANSDLAQNFIERFKIPFLSDQKMFEAIKNLIISLDKLDKTGEKNFTQKVILIVKELKKNPELSNSIREINFYNILKQLKIGGIAEIFNESEVNGSIANIIQILADKMSEAEIEKLSSGLDFYNVAEKVFKDLQSLDKQILLQLAKDINQFQAPLQNDAEKSKDRENLAKLASFLDKFLSSDFMKLMMVKASSEELLETERDEELFESIEGLFAEKIQKKINKEKSVEDKSKLEVFFMSLVDNFGGQETRLGGVKNSKIRRILEKEFNSEQGLGGFILRYLLSDERTQVDDLINDEFKEILVEYKDDFKCFFQKWLFKIDLEKFVREDNQEKLEYYQKNADAVYDLGMIILEELIDYRKNLENYQDSSLPKMQIVILNIISNEKFAEQFLKDGAKNAELFQELLPNVLKKFGLKSEEMDHVMHSLGQALPDLVKILKADSRVYNREAGKLDYKRLILEIEKPKVLEASSPSTESYKLKENIKNIVANLFPEKDTEKENNEKKVTKLKEYLKLILPLLRLIDKGIEATEKSPKIDDNPVNVEQKEGFWQRVSDKAAQYGGKKLLEAVQYGGHKITEVVQENGKKLLAERLEKGEKIIRAVRGNIGGYGSTVGAGLQVGIPLLYYYAQGLQAENYEAGVENKSEQILDEPGHLHQVMQYFAGPLIWAGKKSSDIYNWGAHKFSHILNLGMFAKFGGIEINSATIKNLVIALVEDKEFFELVKGNLGSIKVIIKKTGLLDEVNFKKFETTMDSLIQTIENGNKNVENHSRSQIVKKLMGDLLEIGLLVTGKLLSLEMQRPSENVEKYYQDLNLIQVEGARGEHSERINLSENLKLYRDPEPKHCLFSEMQFTINKLNMVEFQFLGKDKVVSMVNIDFKSINMESAIFKDLKIEGCRFENCNMDKIKFEGCYLKNVVFKNCDLTKVDLSQIKAENVIFEDVILTENQLEILKQSQEVNLKNPEISQESKLSASNMSKKGAER